MDNKSFPTLTTLLESLEDLTIRKSPGQVEDSSTACSTSHDVVIDIGPRGSRRTFQLPCTLLIDCSTYFCAALRSGNFLEARTCHIILAEEGPITFSRFETWLCTRELDLPTTADHKGAIDFLATINFWLFADRRGIHVLANAVLDFLHGLVVQHWQLPTCDLDHIFVNTTPNNPLRRFVVDLLVNTWGVKDLKRVDEVAWSEEVWREIFKASVVAKESKTEGNRTREQVARMLLCTYHFRGKGGCLGDTTKCFGGENWLIGSVSVRGGAPEPVVAEEKLSFRSRLERMIGKSS